MIGAGIIMIKNNGWLGVWIPDSLQIWHEDYYGNFNARIFEDWFDTIRDKSKTRTARLGSTCIVQVIMCDASSTSSWTKPKIREWLTEMRIYHEPSSRKVDLLTLVNHHKPAKQFAVPEIAQK